MGGHFYNFYVQDLPRAQEGPGLGGGHPHAAPSGTPSEGKAIT